MILNPHFLYSIIICFQRVLLLIHTKFNIVYIKVEIEKNQLYNMVTWWVCLSCNRPNTFRIVFPLVLPQIYWKFGLLVLWFLFKPRKFERFAAWTDHDVVILLCSFRHGSKGRAFLLYICSSSSNTKKDNTCESLGVRTNWR